MCEIEISDRIKSRIIRDKRGNDIFIKVSFFSKFIIMIIARITLIANFYFYLYFYNVLLHDGDIFTLDLL